MSTRKRKHDGFPKIIAKPNSVVEGASVAEIAAAWQSIKGIRILEEHFDAKGNNSSRIEISLKDGSVQRVNFKRDRIGRAEVSPE